MKKNILIFFTLIFLLLACSESQDQIANDDELRIVSLNPSATEVLYYIGAGGQVVAVDSYSDYPPEAPSESELDAINPDLEKVLNYDPTLVILGIQDSDIEKGLTQQGIKVVVQETAINVAELKINIIELGDNTNKKVESEELVKKIDKKISDSRKLMPKVPQKIYHEISEGNSGYFVHYDKTFVGDIYSKLGLTNISKSEYLNSGMMDPENIVNSNPDIILVDSLRDVSQSVSNRPGWDTISAIKSGNIYSINPDLSSRSGPRVVEFIDEVVRVSSESANSE